MSSAGPSHFQGKTAMQHLAEKQANGVCVSSEIHGAETPGSIFAACDAAKEAALIVLLLSVEFLLFQLPLYQMYYILTIFSLGFIIWRFGRSAHLAWSRLERLHRVAQEEEHEIELNRSEEREELRVLYGAKGFQGKLLEEVVDVLMADGDRLLRVMLQEEMGFRLEESQHPLIQGLGAACGAFFGVLFPIIGLYFVHGVGVIVGAIVSVAIAAYIAAAFQKNKSVAAIVWDVGVLLISYISVLSCLRFVLFKEGV